MVNTTTSEKKALVGVRRRQTVGAMVVVTFAALALTAAVVLRRDGPTVTEMGMNRTTTSDDGTVISYTKLGSGPPLVIVDGAFCYRENGPASQLAPLLAKHFTVFAYDRRGRGASGDASAYAIEREVEDLRSLLRVAGGPARAVGISSGGALTLQAAASGVSLSSLALYEPHFIEEDGHPRLYDAQKRRLNELMSAEDRAGAVRFFMTSIYGAPRAFVAVMPFVMRSAWTKNQSVAHTLIYDLTLLEDWSILRERRASITIPTLVVGGENSPVPLKDAVAMVAGALPNGRRLYLDGQNHNLSARSLAPVLVEFFGVRQPARAAR
jgi:pimeloyl-ACP methyl ester carboxylesterase